MLEYNFERRREKKILINKWDEKTRDVVWREVIPPGIL